jgi:hypothetical protein
MRQSDSLELIDAGSLVRPGPIGRLVRLVLGVGCLYVLGVLFYYAESTTTQPFSSLANRFLMLLAPLWILNYVVNIGFSKSWGQRPRIFSLVILAIAAVSAFVVSGSFDSPIFGLPLNLWLGYFYGHLGLSFVLSALIATPGCEMRAIPEIIGRISGHASAEHHCPAGFITQLDAWEQRRIAS